MITNKSKALRCPNQNTSNTPNSYQRFLKLGEISKGFQAGIGIILTSSCVKFEWRWTNGSQEEKAKHEMISAQTGICVVCDTVFSFAKSLTSQLPLV
jgi:hypothetical protein